MSIPATTGLSSGAMILVLFSMFGDFENLNNNELDLIKFNQIFEKIKEIEKEMQDQENVQKNTIESIINLQREFQKQLTDIKLILCSNQDFKCNVTL